MSTVIPAAAQAAAKVIVEVTCFKNRKLLEKMKQETFSFSQEYFVVVSFQYESGN